MSDPLTRLAVIYGTDKFGYHDYTPNYHCLFRHLRDKPIKMLEIGVGGYGDEDRGGQSLEVWRDYFPKGEITGIDIQKKTMDLGPRVEIRQGSQVDEEFLRTLVAERGSFDVILDDGSHRNEHVVQSFGVLFPTLKPGGIYVVEDVQTAFFPRFGGSITLDEPNSVGLFASFVRELDEDNPSVADIASLERFHNIVVAHKHMAPNVGSGIFGSRSFEHFSGRSAQVLVIGDEECALSAFPFSVGKLHHHSTLSEEDLGLKDYDIVVLSVAQDNLKCIADMTRALTEMRDNSVLVVRCAGALKGFRSTGPVMDFVTERFVEVDHREISIHYSDYQPSPLAKSIYAIERTRGAILFRKAPNDYPSNFAFDPEHPAVSEALSLMESVVADEANEGGLVSFAEILARHRSKLSAATYVDRLTEMGAQSRRYFMLAISTAYAKKDEEGALRLAELALQHFPDEPQFTTWLSNSLVRKGDLDRAERELRSTYERNSRARRAAIAGLTRILMLKGELEEAAELTKSSIGMFPIKARAQRYRFLSTVLLRMKDSAGAEQALMDAAECERGAGRSKAP